MYLYVPFLRYPPPPHPLLWPVCLILTISWPQMHIHSLPVNKTPCTDAFYPWWWCYFSVTSVSRFFGYAAVTVTWRDSTLSCIFSSATCRCEILAFKLGIKSYGCISHFIYFCDLRFVGRTHFITGFRLFIYFMQLLKKTLLLMIEFHFQEVLSHVAHHEQKSNNRMILINTTLH